MRSSLYTAFLALSLALMASVPFQSTRAQDVGRASVFEYVTRNAEGSISSVGDRIAEQAQAAGFELVSRAPIAVPGECGYSAEVLALVNRTNAAALMTANPRTGAYAVIDRVLVFSDEDGVHTAIVNPLGVLRTILVDAPDAASLGAPHRQALRNLAAVPGQESGTGYGPSRDRGLIGKTMGVMAGGPFDEKIQIHGTAPGTDWKGVAAAVESAFARPEPAWGLQARFAVQFEDYEVAVIGVSGAAMESRSFDIVGAGSDGSRGSFDCPGLAHGAAYPLEVIVVSSGDQVEVQFVDAMYRMKMYFEDAGKWAFMKNMTMPGSIADALKEGIARALVSL